MSYNFRIIKDAEGARVVKGYGQLGEPLSESDLATIPDGSFVVSGHHVQAGEQGTESLSIQHLAPGSPWATLQSSSSKSVDNRVDEPATT